MQLPLEQRQRYEVSVLKPQGFRHLTSSVVHGGFSSYYSSTYYTACSDVERFQATDEVHINNITNHLQSSHGFNSSRHNIRCSAKVFTSFSICEDKEWSDICDDNFTASDATVVCRELGYSDTGTERLLTMIMKI